MTARLGTVEPSQLIHVIQPMNVAQIIFVRKMIAKTNVLLENACRVTHMIPR